MRLTDLATRWRERATELRAWAAAEGAASALEGAATELEEAVRNDEDEPLALDQAACESGYSKRRLRELVASGEIPNAGRKGAPRIRRADLPHKPASSGLGSYDVDADADRLSGRMQGG